MWAMRIIHEAHMYQSGTGSVFVTLTYRDKRDCNDEQLEKGYYLPTDRSLHKSHVQKFLKRLRHHYDDKIKYFMCGEYGSICTEHRLPVNREKMEQTGLPRCRTCNVGRPHYHAILFNCTFEDLYVFDGEFYTSKFLEDTWKYGFVSVGEVNVQTAAYVARYNLKKVNGTRADEQYFLHDEEGQPVWVTPEFATMSNGIGKDFYEYYKGDFWPSDESPVPGQGVVKKVPRYYQERLKKEDAGLLTEIQEVRRLFREKHAEEYTPERLLSRYKCAKQRQKLKEDRL